MERNKYCTHCKYSSGCLNVWCEYPYAKLKRESLVNGVYHTHATCLQARTDEELCGKEARMYKASWANIAFDWLMGLFGSK